MTRWLSVVGMGEDGIEGLSPAARTIIETAEVLAGGKRHLEKVPADPRDRLTWQGGMGHTVEAIAELKPRRVAVIVSGDPMHYGIGPLLARRFDAGEMTIVPAPGAFSLAAARMGWSLADVEVLSVHGRPVETMALHLAPGVRLLVLSRDGDSPGAVARVLRDRGFGPSPMTVLEHMGGPHERRVDGTAADWAPERASDLNTMAVECRAAPDARPWPRVAGLPEEAFEHDGQITKREVRAVTLAALAPLPGQTLWDVGAGSGAVGIEWLRAIPSGRAVAVECDAGRAAAIARNAAALGVPDLEVVAGEAPEALSRIETPPDAVFVGGGVSRPGVMEAAWQVLAGGGRLVANAVTIEAEEKLLSFRNEAGGDLTRLAISRARPVGRLSGFEPMREVTQLVAVKP